MTESFTITERAAKRVAAMIEGEGNPGLKLRVAVSGGGCSGFQYGFSLEEKTTDEDRTFVSHGVTVVVDDMSLELLEGGELDYVEDMMGSSFRISNPNATATCGCGTSFSV